MTGYMAPKKEWRRKVVAKANRRTYYSRPLRYREWQQAIFRLRQAGVSLPQGPKMQ